MIHVAGTKGKGSTCAFTQSILRNHGIRTGFPTKIGLYTSPHLRHLEERIRINCEPIHKGLFVKYFFEVWERIFVKPVEDEYGLPRYLQLLALVSFHTFLCEQVDVAIFETHHGGEFDSTNVVDSPSVTAVTTLGMDHVNQLGPTIQNIAWHKSGIFKTGAAALTTKQQPSALVVLEQRALDKGIKLQVTIEDGTLTASAPTLQPRVQRLNATLAVSIARNFLRQRGPKHGGLTTEDISKGIEQFSWPGRFQTVLEGPTTWFLDSAHNDISITEAADWFAHESLKTKR
jgi:folylpolyglutamate synthase